MSATGRRTPTGGAAPLLAATAISVTGDGALAAAGPLLAATLTTDPLVLSVVSAASLLPWLLVGLHAGAYADRWPRRRILVVADLARAAVLGVLVLLLATGHLTIALLAAAVLLIGVGQCFFDSAAQAMIPALVGRDKNALTTVNGRFWALNDAGDLAGNALGSLAFAAGRAVPFAADAVSFLASAALVRMLPDVPTTGLPGGTSVSADIRAGLRFVLRHPQLRLLVAVMCAANAAFSIAMATFVLYATQVLDVPVAGYGLLLAAASAGGMLGGWWSGRLTRRLSYRHTLAVACLAQAGVWAAIVVTGTVWVAGPALVLLGATGTVATVAIVSARAEQTPNGMLGRVSSVFRLIGIGVASATALLGGALAAAFGLRAPMVAAVALLLATTTMALWKRRIPLSAPGPSRREEPQSPRSFEE